MNYEGSLIWSRFTAMVYANTITMAAISVILASSQAVNLKFITILIAFLGILLCVCWYILNRRGFAYYKYWIFSARELEEQHLSPVHTLSNGAAFSSGMNVMFAFNAGTEHHKAQGVEKWKVKAVNNVIILGFVVLYLVIVFFSGCYLKA